MSKLVIFFVAILLIGTGGSLLWLTIKSNDNSQVKSGAEEVVYDGPPIEDFQLVDSQGGSFDSKDLDGQIWVANYFYSTCAMGCSEQSRVVQTLHMEFADRGVKFVSITCDAETDSPSILQTYADRYGAKPESWSFLTGEQHYLERVGQDVFKLPVEARAHSERLVLIDREGEIQGRFNFKNPTEVAQLKAKLNDLLNESPEAESHEAESTEGASPEGADVAATATSESDEEVKVQPEVTNP